MRGEVEPIDDKRRVAEPRIWEVKLNLDDKRRVHSGTKNMRKELNLDDKRRVSEPRIWEDEVENFKI